jgi:DNA (cytosine-5)-methyltransferase 1
MPVVIREDFAGPGGWDEGARLVGVSGIVGYESDKHACATATAAGHERIRGDVTTLVVDGIFWGYIASPPCQAWSRAGKRQGILDQLAIFAHLDAVIAAGEWIDYPRDGWHDDRSPLVLEVVRAILQGRPTWVALEQVPDVLPFWEKLAGFMETLGYRTWTGILDAEMYGVPQTRDRAILTGSLDPAHNVSRPPATHARYQPGKPYVPDLFGELLPPVSMADALDWGMTERPSMTVTGGGSASGGAEPFGSGARAGIERERERELGVRAYRLHRGAGMTERNGDRPDTPVTRPAPVITSKARAATWVETQNFSAVARNADGGHDAAHSVRYSRSTDEPSPTVTAQVKSWRYRNGNQPNAAERDVDEPAPTIAFGHASSRVEWVNERPATTVQGDPRIAGPGHRDREGGQRQFDEESVRVTVTEAAILQSFRPDYPWQGSRIAQFQQVGNAIPPLLAAAILGHLLGRKGWRDVCRDTYQRDGAA